MLELTNLRIFWKLKQSDVEAATGIPQARISEIERGLPPTDAQLRACPSCRSAAAGLEGTSPSAASEGQEVMLTRSRAKVAAMLRPGPRGSHLLCARCDAWADANGSCPECKQSDMVTRCHRDACGKCRKGKSS
jgi:hypothetical protein